MSQRAPKALAYWLLALSLWIVGTAVIGAITRLTDSGLTMMTWDAVEPWWPSAARIRQYFALYQTTPESQVTAFTFDQFIPRFFWEWFHRNWGRALGLLALGGTLYFAVRRQMPRAFAPVVVAAPFLIGFQGFLGWFMVHSGFDTAMGVSHYRLALHLGGAFVALGLFYWTALRILCPTPNWSLPRTPWVLGFGLLILTLIFGAFTAGLNAADASRTWPHFHEDQFFPRVLCDGDAPWAPSCWVNSPWGVHFVHRTLALAAATAIGGAAVTTLVRRPSPASVRIAGAALAVVTTQFCLGVWLVLMPGSILNPSAAKLALAVGHQVGGIALFILVLTALYGGAKGASSAEKAA